MALLDEIIREWARTEIQQKDIVNYNGANMAYNHAVDIANKLKLTDAQKLGVSPFPANSTTTVSTVQDSRSVGASLVSRFLPLILGAALGGGGVALGLALQRAGEIAAPAPGGSQISLPARGPGDVGLTVEGFLKGK